MFQLEALLSLLTTLPDQLQAVKLLWDVEKCIRQMRWANESLQTQERVTGFPAEEPASLPRNLPTERCKGDDAEFYRMEIDKTKTGDTLKEVIPIMKSLLTFLATLCTHSKEEDPLMREGAPDVMFQDICLQQNAINLVIEFLQVLFLGEEGHLGIPGWLFARNLVHPHACMTALLSWRFLKQVIQR